MERLTQRSTWDGGVYFTKKPKGFFCYENPCSQAIKCEKVDDKTCPHLAVLERLAAYEDTGLDPESVEQMQDVFGRGLTFLEDARERLEIIEGISTGRLRDLVKADREGRIKIEPKARKCTKCGKYSVFPRIDWKYYYCFSCKTQFSESEYKSLLERVRNEK